MPLTPSTLNMSVPQVQVIPPSESSSSDNQDQEPEDNIDSDHLETASLLDSLHTHEDIIQDQEDYLDDQEEEV